MGELDARAAVERLERRGGEIQIRSSERAGTSPRPIVHVETYACVDRDTESVIVVGPPTQLRRWILRTEPDRLRLATDIEARVQATSARADRVDVELRHVDQLQADGGLAEVGCVVALLSTVVGWLVGMGAAYLSGHEVSTLIALGAPIVSFVLAMSTADGVGGILVVYPPARDRIVNVVYAYVALVPGLLTALLIFLTRSS